MARVKNGAVTKARHKKVLKAAKGYFGSKHRLYKRAKEQLMTAKKYAYRDRKQKKRDFRKLWITRINAACRMNEISYSRFISGLSKAGVEVNRKMLSEIAINEPDNFKALVEVAKKGLDGKVKADEKKIDKEVTINGSSKKEEVKKKVAAKKAEVKEKVEEKKADVKKKVATKKAEVKAKVKESIDYTKMTVAELKEEAKKKKIATTGLKKADIIAALKK
ncbi:MAG: 50S ribosomal protein L20 [Bacilli bacterium]|nr:50S ribosomal protein L20 [Bacilli bacterium]